MFKENDLTDRHVLSNGGDEDRLGLLDIQPIVYFTPSGSNFGKFSDDRQICPKGKDVVTEELPLSVAELDKLSEQFSLLRESCSRVISNDERSLSKDEFKTEINLLTEGIGNTTQYIGRMTVPDLTSPTKLQVISKLLQELQNTAFYLKSDVDKIKHNSSQAQDIIMQDANKSSATDLEIIRSIYNSTEDAYSTCDRLKLAFGRDWDTEDRKIKIQHSIKNGIQNSSRYSYPIDSNVRQDTYQAIDLWRKQQQSYARLGPVINSGREMLESIDSLRRYQEIAKSTHKHEQWRGVSLNEILANTRQAAENTISNYQIMLTKPKPQLAGASAELSERLQYADEAATIANDYAISVRKLFNEQDIVDFQGLRQLCNYDEDTNKVYRSNLLIKDSKSLYGMSGKTSSDWDANPDLLRTLKLSNLAETCENTIRANIFGKEIETTPNWTLLKSESLILDEILTKNPDLLEGRGCTELVQKVSYILKKQSEVLRKSPSALSIALAKDLLLISKRLVLHNIEAYQPSSGLKIENYYSHSSIADKFGYSLIDYLDHIESLFDLSASNNESNKSKNEYADDLKLVKEQIAKAGPMINSCSLGMWRELQKRLLQVEQKVPSINR